MLLKKLLSFIWDFFETIVVALLVYFVVSKFLFQPHRVKGSSMHPNLENGEFLLTNKLVYRFGDPKYGDIIVFHAPNEEHDYIKRIIALPGDRVKIIDNKFYINGFVLDESKYLNSDVKTYGERFLKDDTEIIIPPNSYFVVGDNRENSSDSRDFGSISYNSIVGKAFFRYWPPQVFGLIKNTKN